MARDPSLEAKLIENPADTAQYLVYADFLQSQGDPRGELIALQAAGKREAADALLTAHEGTLLGALKNYRVTFDGSEEPALFWRNGFIRKAVLSLDTNLVEEVEVEDGVEPSLEAALTELLQHPSGALLEELQIDINMLDDGAYFSSLVHTLEKYGAPALRKLRIGRFHCCGGPGGEGNYEYEISWTTLGDASGLWKAVPRLEHLVIQSGLGNSSADQRERDLLGAIEHPTLKHLEFITGGLSLECVQSIARAKLPALQHLDVWFGDENYGAGGTVDELAPLFEGGGFPALRHLGLMNAAFSNEIADALPRARIVKQLESLSLRYGTLDDTGISSLLKIPTLSALRVDVRDNFVTTGACASLAAKARGVDDHPQRNAAEDRYVSLSE